MELLVRLLAKRCGRPYDASLLCRRTQTVQRGATAKDRQMQAKGAFCVIGEVNKDAVYILVDDVMTTGATLQYSARVLKEAGATEVWIVVLARQIFS
jgi:predicted amidophosphoribosyltransferase